MDPLGRFQKFQLNGKTDRAQQLNHVSLVDARDNSFVGLNAGTKVVGSENTAVGANAMVTSQRVSNNTVVGARAGETLQDAQQNVAVGALAAQKAANVVAGTYVGYQAGQYASKSSYNTAVGWH